MCPLCQMRLAINADCPRCRDVNGPCLYCMSCASLWEVGRRIRETMVYYDKNELTKVTIYYVCTPAISAPVKESI